MQLAVVADYWDSSRGGERYLVDLIHAIGKAGHSVHIYCQECGNDDSRGLSVHTVAHVRYPRFLGDWNFCRRVDRQLRAQPRQPVLAFRPVASASHYQLPAGLYSVSFEAEREALDSRLRRWLYRPAMSFNFKRRLLMRMQERLLTGRDGPKVMANSNLVRDQLQRVYGVSGDAVVVLTPGIDLNRFQPSSALEGPHWRRAALGQPDELLLLFVAHNFLLKGLHCLFEALGVARRRGVKASLLVAGNGPIAKFQRLAAHFGIASLVSFLGAVTRDTLVRLYRSCDVLVHPTFYDPCSAVVLEALACACPVITTRRNGAAELMESGKHGFVLDHPRNIDGLVEALHALRDLGERERMSRDAALLGRNFDLQAHAAKVMAWLGLGDES